MANMLQSSQNQATTAPSFYTDYLSNLATKGQEAAGKAQFAGAQPLQTEAFCKVAANFGAQQPAFQTGQGYVGQAAGQDVTGAASPFLQAGTTASPLCALKPYATQAMCTTGYEVATPLVCRGASTSGLSAATPYLQKATGTSPADLAAQYMNPYIDTAVKSMSDIAQRNIRQNLAPAATAASVGSGQFGSQRGAQVLGQVKAQAEQDLNNQIAQMLSSGYGQALCAAGKQNALVAGAGQTAGTLQNQTAQNLVNAGLGLGSQQTSANQIAANLGSTATTAQTAQNQANLTAGQTAAQAAANEAQILNQAGVNMGALGTQAGTQNLACINALATLGGQQQTIEQNKQNFPLTNLANLSTLLQGYSIPTSTQTTLCMSPLSGVAAVGTGLGALLQTNKCGTNLLCSITGSKTFGCLAGKAFSGLTGIFSAPPGTTTYAGQNACGTNVYYNSSTGNYTDSSGNVVPISGGEGEAKGGRIEAKAIGGSVGGLSGQGAGGMPVCMEAGMMCNAGTICTPYQMARGGLASMIRAGQVGCMSTQKRGALPSKKG